MSVASHSPSPFAAELLRQSAPALAALSTERLLARVPDLSSRYQPNPSIRWRENIAARVQYLSAAVATGRPHVFVHQSNWDKIAHTARGGPIAAADVEASMHCLREVLAEELPPHASAPAIGCLDAAIAHFAGAPTQVPTLLSPQSPHGRLAAEYLLAILEGDRLRACNLIMDAVRSGHHEHGPVPILDIYTQVLTPVQQELGRMWHMNESSVAEEHFATATTHTVMSMLYPLLPRRSSNGKVALCASVETNAHDIGVRMIADVLEIDGWRTIYLGQNVPAEDFTHAVIDFRVDLLALSASLVTHLPIMADTIRKLRAAPHAPKHLKVLVGGPAFNADPERTLWQTIGADAFASSIADAPIAARRVMGI